MHQKLIAALQERYPLNNIHLEPVHGGDINHAFRMELNGQSIFIKANYSSIAPALLQREYNALQYFEKVAIVPVPKTNPPIVFEGGSFLSMEYIASTPCDENSWKSLAASLVKLHQVTSKTFGWEEDNYIGTLPQPNTIHVSWPDFYLEQRLSPQIRSAFKNGYFTKDHQPLIKQFENCVPHFLIDTQPSLVHGDLWSGNFIVDSQGIAYLIDPAAYFGHREVDLAMTKLFGGFSESFYHHYQQLMPLEKGFEERESLYQLYYLLVHLNLFGTGYLERCLGIMSSYATK